MKLFAFRYSSRWKRELLICVLMKRGVNDIALKVLRCSGVPISPVLEILVLIANNLVSEALLIQRKSGDKEILKQFFNIAFDSPYYDQLLDLTFTDDEEFVLRDYIERTDRINSVNIHLVHLLQKAKFLDATNLLEKSNWNSDSTKVI